MAVSKVFGEGDQKVRFSVVEKGLSQIAQQDYLKIGMKAVMMAWHQDTIGADRKVVKKVALQADKWAEMKGSRWVDLKVANQADEKVDVLAVKLVVGWACQKVLVKELNSADWKGKYWAYKKVAVTAERLV